MKSPIRLTILLIGSTIPALLTGAVSVPNLFGDHMVIQRDQPVRIWGKADAGEGVSVALGGHTATAVTADSGHWRVELPPLPAGGPHTMDIMASNSLRFQNILVGEVWVASGQSNMAWRMRNAIDGDLHQVLARRAPRIRFLPVKNEGGQQPAYDPQGSWTIAAPDSLPDFSAVGYFFALSLHDALGVPVGIIENAWGGSSAEAWVPREAIAADPVLGHIDAEWREREADFDYAAELAQHAAALAEWEVAAREAEAAGAKPPAKPRKPSNILTAQHRPGNLWNGRVMPIAPYSVRGVIWYQGESNAGRAAEYHRLFPMLIRQWRDLWGAELPFYWAQLADFRAESYFDDAHTWPLLREAQTHTLNTVAATGQAVIIDVGEGKDIHPRQKEAVGRRLARWALNRDYGFEALVYRSPEFASWNRRGNEIVIKFNYTGGGLRAFDTAAVSGFVVRDASGEWLPVEGRVSDKDTVVLSVEAGTEVDAIRYAWADNPVCNLFSLEGLPATPFRTDGPEAR
jgi:sialate O-acetylesterase